jgi:hypothetical protein
MWGASPRQTLDIRLCEYFSPMSHGVLFLDGAITIGTPERKLDFHCYQCFWSEVHFDCPKRGKTSLLALPVSPRHLRACQSGSGIGALQVLGRTSRAHPRINEPLDYESP